MGLAISFCIDQSDDCKSIRFTDTTGVYNANSNPGGFGAPNPTVASALTAKVLVEKRNSDGTFITYNLIDVFPTLPSDSQGFVTITAQQAGIGTSATTSFPDGVYRLTYTITGNTGVPYTFITDEYVPLVCSIKCCWKKLTLQVSNCTIGCDALYEKLKDMSLNFRLLKAAEDKGDIDTVQRYIDSITKLCADCSCSCGC